MVANRQDVGPMTAGLCIQTTANLSGLPLTPWQGLGVLALWAAGALTQRRADPPLPRRMSLLVPVLPAGIAHRAVADPSCAGQ